VINGEVLTADEINSLISPQRVEPQYASKNTLPGYLFADQLRQQLLENNRYLMQFYTNVKYSKPDLIKQPEALQKRV
jgi:hypothetical protein